MEAGACHCPSCGAPVAAEALQCPYCHTPLATVACPKCLTLVSQHAAHCPQCGTALEQASIVPTSFTCPDCHTPLSAAIVGGVELDQCPGCSGVWVAQPSFEKIAASREERGQIMGALPATPKVPVAMETVHYRPCPQCGKLMNRLNYAHISGVVLDVCKAHGLWFDKDELRQVMTFIEAGGLEKERNREVQQLAEQRRPAVELPRMGGDWSDQAPGINAGGLGLARVVESLVSLFTH